MWGAAPRPGRGRALSRPGERRTENGEQNARQAGDRRNSCTTRKPNFQASKIQASKLPLSPAPPARLRRAKGRRGRTNRTNRTYRTAASPVDAQNQSVACEARHAPTGSRAGRAPCAHVRPAPCVVLSRGRFVASRLHGVPLWFFVFLAVEGLALWACTVIAAQRSVSSPQRRRPGLQPLWLLQASKPPNFQASKYPLCPSCPL